MKYLQVFSFFLALLLCRAEKFLIIPEVGSQVDLKTAERLSKIIESTGVPVGVLLHQIDVEKWQEKSISTIAYGNSDELRSGVQGEAGNRDDVLITQIKQYEIVKYISQEHFDILICKWNDYLCQYISENVDFQKEIFLINSCPRNWNEAFEAPQATSLIQKIMDFFLSFFKSTPRSIKHKPDALYFSECLQPLYNTKPDMQNIFPIGSLLGDQTKKQLPDTYIKPIMLANKIIFISLGEDETHFAPLIYEVANSFSHYLFIIQSKTFQIGNYALGNIVVDENIDLNTVLSHDKTTLIISNGQWSVLLNALYHGVPPIIVGSSQEGEIGRWIVKDKNLGIDLSSKKVNLEVMQDAIREIIFNTLYKNKVKDVSRYLKGQNTQYLIPNVIFNYFAAKKQKTSDL